MFNFNVRKQPKRFGYDCSTENSEIGSEEEKDKKSESSEGGEEEISTPSFKPDSLNSILSDEEEEEITESGSKNIKLPKKSNSRATSKNIIQKNESNAITKKKKLKKSGAKDYGEKQNPKRKSDDHESETDEERPKHKKLSTSKAKLDTSRLTFDELYDEFEAQNPGEIDNNRRPPYVSRLGDEDLDKLIDWQRRKIVSENKLREDPMYQFIQLVAAYTHTNIKQYITISAGGGSSRLTVGPANTNTISGTSPSKLSSPPPEMPLGLTRKKKANLKENQSEQQQMQAKFVDEEKKKKRFGVERTIWDLLEDEEYEDEAKDLLRRRQMFESLDWVEDVQTTGIMDISPMIYGHVVMAHDLIKIQCPRIAYSIEQLATHSELRVRFAQLTAVLVDLSKFLSPTRSQLDRNYARLQHQKTMILYSLSNWSKYR